MWRSVLVVVFMAVLAGCGSSERPEKHLEKGFVHFQQQEYDKAIESYEKAIKAGAKSAGTYNMLGMAYRFKFQKTGKPELQEKELAAFQRALEIDPKYWVAMVNLGTTYYSRGEKSKAAPLFKKALALNPGHPEKAQLEKMIGEGEQGAGGGSAESYRKQGEAHFQKQEYDLAIKSYEKAIELDPKSAVACNLLGMACRFSRNKPGSPDLKDREVAAFQKAIEIDPNYEVALINLGATYYFQGEKAKAAPLFKKALAINPNNPKKAELEKMIAEGEAQK